MKTIEPYVKLLGKMDHRKEAWKTSRPETWEETPFNRVEEMDLSLNSMCVYTFEMRSSIFFRDLILALRPIEAWALSFRALNATVDNTRISGEYEDGMGQVWIVQFFDKISSGVSKDNARECLPLSVSCTYTFTIDYRVLVSFCKTIQEVNQRLYREHCIPMLVEADIPADVYDVSKVKQCLDYCRITENEMINGINQTGNMVHGHYRMKLAHASQFLRQHYSKIKIGLWNLIPDYYILDMQQKDLIDVVFYIDIFSYRRLMAMRSHWNMDWNMDMWGQMVGEYIIDMNPSDFWEFTPAGGGRPDPYYADVYNRIIGAEAGVPCPIMTEWRGAIDERRKETGANPVLDMYERLFDDGFIKDNPDNEHRIKYFEFLENQ